MNCVFCLSVFLLFTFIIFNIIIIIVIIALSGVEGVWCNFNSVLDVFNGHFSNVA